MEQLQSQNMANGLLIYGIHLRISSYTRKPFLIFDFAIAPLLNFLIYEENLIFLFISAGQTGRHCRGER
jgi:hypothetical protein